MLSDTDIDLLDSVGEVLREGLQGLKRDLEGQLAALKLELMQHAKGSPGEPGHAGTDGKDGAPGERGRDGADGRSVTLEEVRPLVEAKCDAWALDFERRAQDLLQRAVDRLPKAKDGLDGLGFDDLQLEYDGERTLTLRFARGDRVKEYPFVVPWPLDRGVWKAGETYRRGDGVTWDSSWYIAQTDTSAKPAMSKDWRMAARKGVDGRDGAKGDKGETGSAGRHGRDLTNLGSDGSKWA